MSGSLHNLPAALTSFVGRQRELEEVERLLATARLLTITGVGGGGKTRLVLRLAEAALERYADGVWLVELAALADPTLAPRAVATALGLQEEAGRPPMETLEAALRLRQFLLVLDNCEHLVQACAELAEALLRTCPRLRILATSREPLRVPGEVTWHLPPLSVPDPDRPPDLEELNRSEAVQLLASRAAAALPTFALTVENADAVARLCHRLGGIPLAIELAAALIPALSVEQIAARLDGHFHLLSGGSRTALPRHQTLEAALDWSHALLSEPERALLRRLAVFAGGFSLEAAEAVCAFAADGNAVDRLCRLVDKSLVVAEGGGAGAVRYRLLEPIRQYAAERLVAAGEAHCARRCHAEYFLALAERAEPELSGPDQATWLERLEREHDNLRAALAWLSDVGDRAGDGGAVQDRAVVDAEAGLRFGWALMRFWDMRGHLAEGRARLATLLRADRAAGPTSARARALFAAGRLAYEQGDYAAALACSEESLTIAREVGDRECVAFALTQVGHVLRIRGDPEAAGPLYEESLAIRRELVARGAATFRPGVAISLKCLGGVALARGDLAGAHDLYTESLAIERELGHRWEIALSLHRLGEIAIDLGRLTEVRGHFGAALAVARELGDRQNIALVLGGVAGLAAAQGEPERAMRLVGAADALRETIKCVLDPADRARVEGRLAGAAALLGQESAARLRVEGGTLPPDGAIAEAVAALTPPERAAGVPLRQRLTRREREVAVLIACGLTNRAIAAELVIAEWTVVNHVRSIMRKLGVGSRAQVAAWSVEQGLPLSRSAGLPC